MADALHWHLWRLGIVTIFLDDYITVAPLDSLLCQVWLDILDKKCQILQVLIVPHKHEGPTTCLAFLGILINTVKGELHLHQDKLQQHMDLVRQWAGHKTCTRKELESFIGLLNHICKAVRSGQSFLQRMIDLLHTVHPPNSKAPIHPNAGFRADLVWWQEFMIQWNSVSFLQPPSQARNCIQMPLGIGDLEPCKRAFLATG